ncbi:RluA family pseudouridine synthase [Myxococcota bacterium]|nr:RluA family pseudouridine synthase [Myxococcota bacterium]
MQELDGALDPLGDEAAAPTEQAEDAEADEPAEVVPDAPRVLRVDPRDAGMRVDVYLSLRFEGWSRSRVATSIRTGQVRSEQRALKPSSTIRAEERLVLDIPRLAPRGPKPPHPPVVHEDRRLVAFNKPPGMLAHPVGRTFVWGLINLARELYPNEELHLLHRLDKETSGLMVLARDDDANRLLKRAFKDRRVEKRYLALVRGLVPWEEREVDAPIGQAIDSPILLKQGVRDDGASAQTRFRVISRHPERQLTLVECAPKTGRTHQIRVHLDYIGFPIFGDKIYGQDPEVFLSLYAERPLPDLQARLGHPRQCLHAATLSLPHPDGGEVTLVAPLAEDMVALIQPEMFHVEHSDDPADAPR